MATFIKYNKIHRLGKDEVEGILDGVCYIQEKLDGANASIWMEDGEIQIASRNQLIKDGESFNGFREYVESNEAIKKILSDCPQIRLYGEWLVRHSVVYKEEFYRKFYLFDILNSEGELLKTEVVYKLAEEYGIQTPELFEVKERPDLEALKKWAHFSNKADHGEGIVIKRDGFIDKFGEYRHAKLTTEKFKETNAMMFNGNNKHSESYWEMYIVHKYITEARIEKIMNKLQPIINEKLDFKHTPRIITTVTFDLLTEEIWDIFKKVPELNFRRLRRLIGKKVPVLYHTILKEREERSL